MDKFTEFTMKRILFYLFSLRRRWECSVSGSVPAPDEEGTNDRTQRSGRGWRPHHEEGRSDLRFPASPSQPQPCSRICPSLCTQLPSYR